MQQLTESGFTKEHIEQAKLISAEHSDVYDVLSYIAYATPVSPEERALMAAEILLMNLKKMRQCSSNLY